jgi:hypothetical protein
LVVYGSQQVRRVELTEANREWLISTIGALRATRLAKAPKRNHNQRGCCIGCGVRAQLRSGSSLMVFAFEIFATFVRFVLTLALAGSKQFCMLRSKHKFPKEAHSIRRPTASNEKVAVLFAELLQRVEGDGVYRFSGSGLVAVGLQKALLDPSYEIAISNCK